MILNRITTLFFFFIVIFLSGCARFNANLPTILTDKDLQWTIPKGIEFEAIQKPAYPTLTKFVVPDDDLAVLYKGSLFELEQEANKKSIRAARNAKRQGTIFGAVGSLFALLSGIFVKNKIMKKGEG